MDSDDILAPTALEEIYKDVTLNQLDLLFFEAHSFGEMRMADGYERKHSYDEVYAGPDLANLLLSNNEFIVSPCLYIASVDLYKNNDIRFLEHVKHEDDIVSILVLLNARRATCIHRDLYARRYRPGSTMTTFDPESSVKGAFRTYCDLLKRRQASESNSVLRSSAADAFLSRCKRETIRHFLHCNVSPAQFVELVGCRDDNERQAARDIVQVITSMGFRFYLARYLRLLKHRISCRVRY